VFSATEYESETGVDVYYTFAQGSDETRAMYVGFFDEVVTEYLPHLKEKLKGYLDERI